MRSGGLVVIDYDSVETELSCFRERFEACHTAIDRNQQPCTALRERTDRVHVRPIAFKDAVGDMDDWIQTAEPQITAEQGRGGRTVDVIVSENGRVFTADHRVGNASGRGLHAREGMRIGQEALDCGVEKGLNVIDLDIPSGQNTGKQFVEPMTLRNGQSERRPARVEPIAPGPPGQRALDAQEMPVAFLQLCSRQSHCASVVLRAGGSPRRIGCRKSHIVAKAVRGHQPGSTGNFGVNTQQFRYRFWVTAAEPALSGN